jgi:protein transport protein SEC61 subunit alpha
MMISGYTDYETLKVLNRNIPIAASCGGMLIGLISIFSDLIGVIGSGTGILLSVSIIYGYYEKLVKDKKKMGE